MEGQFPDHPSRLPVEKERATETAEETVWPHRKEIRRQITKRDISVVYGGTIPKALILLASGRPKTYLSYMEGQLPPALRKKVSTEHSFVFLAESVRAW
ncbi:hypothetical protein AMR44_20870 [Shewanella algae]|nr:hypothetical protein AMR44_20870 [Shewanella algae]